MKNTYLKITEALQAEWPDAKVNVSSRNNDGRHFELSIKTAAFSGKTLLEQHRSVKKCLHQLLQDEIHAISISTEVLA